jgi:tetratricopeptide (TPR) repeat protein
MIRFLKLLFGKKQKHDPSAIVEEIWTPSFKKQKKSRFIPENSATLETNIGAGALALILKKKNLFGWAENPAYRYRDFIIRATIEVDPSNGHSSAGFLLRRADDLNYYFFLVSPAGHFRFDVVFNGNPRTLIPWTPCPPHPETIELRILARGGYFSFFLEEEWIGEIEDETVDAGNVTFAAQNYEERDTARFNLTHLNINSIPYDVEAQYYRWRRYVPVEPERRVALARSLASQGSYQTACIQFGIAEKEMPLNVQDLLTLTESYLRNGLTKEAASAVDKALALEENNPHAMAAKADLLYRNNRILELRDYLVSNRAVFKDNAVMWNLLGNAWYALGNHNEAAEAYEQACKIDPDFALYRVHAARTYEKLKQRQKALELYLSAARLFFREEDYAELSGILPLIERFDKNNRDVLAIRGKIAFSEGRFEDALADLESAVLELDEDSSVHYLYGMLLAQNGERERAAEHFARATDLEPEYYLYWFRRAENEHILNRDADQSIQQALALSPKDRWVLNLGGLIALEQGKDTEARELLYRAYSSIEIHDEKIDPADVDILINYTEALFRNGEISNAVTLLKPFKDEASLVNQMGNLLSREGNYEGAVAAYERALRLAPDVKDYQLNCAAACIEADRVLRAEEILGRLLDQGDDAVSYNLIGNAAQIKGEAKRAEAAYTRALQTMPTYENAAFNLADLQMRLQRFTDAAQTVETFLSDSQNPRVGKMKERIQHETEIEISCAECGRKWITEKMAETQPRIKIHGELPDDAPAGMCTSCGKVYCIGCAKAELRDGRFYCLECKKPLRLLTDHLKLIVSRYAK